MTVFTDMCHTHLEHCTFNLSLNGFRQNTVSLRQFEQGLATCATGLHCISLKGHFTSSSNR